MSGMITTGDTNLSTYGSRTVAIEVTGVCRQEVMRTSNYTVKVPYSRMSQTIQSINRMGGKVAGISLGNSEGTIKAAAPTAPIAPIETEKSQADNKRRSGGRKNRNRK